MRDYIDLGASPYEEQCAQVGRPDYWDQARRECREYIKQLRRRFGAEPDGTTLVVTENPHDFGTYLSVVCRFDSARPQSVEYAFRCEREMPGLWDEEALRELGLDEGRGL